jgi:predicted ATP-dependent endonuclease of OLD family
MSIKKVIMENFLVFKNKLEIDFASGVNVIIGENATGKTTLLKGMYACLQINNNKQNDVDRTKDDISKYFSPFSRNAVFVLNKFDVPDWDDRITNFIGDSEEISENMNVIKDAFDEYRKKNDKLPATLENIEKNIFTPENMNTIKVLKTLENLVQEAQVELNVTIESNNKEVVINPAENKFHTERTSSLFIPHNDMLTHSKGFMSLYNKRMVPFDKTLYDIIENALMPNLREAPQEQQKILDIASKVIDGEVIVEDEVFYVLKNNDKKVEFSFEAEGLKKFGLIWKLIRNGLLEKDTVLFWDEPENSLNPKLMKELGEIILELSRIGVQVFLATHSGNIAREIAQQKNDTDSVMYFSLYREDEDDPYGEVFLEHDNRLDMLPHNVMQNADVDLYYRELGLEYDG